MSFQSVNYPPSYLFMWKPPPLMSAGYGHDFTVTIPFDCFVISLFATCHVHRFESHFLHFQWNWLIWLDICLLGNSETTSTSTYICRSRFDIVEVDLILANKLQVSNPCHYLCKCYLQVIICEFKTNSKLVMQMCFWGEIIWRLGMHFT